MVINRLSVYLSLLPSLAAPLLLLLDAFADVVPMRVPSALAVSSCVLCERVLRVQCARVSFVAFRFA